MTDTVHGLLTEHAARTPAKEAIVEPDGRLDYAALDARSRSLAAALVTAGVGKGTRVGLIMPNGIDWVTHALAITRIGAVLVPLSTLATPSELLSQLRVSSTRHLISVDEFRGHRYLDALRTHLRCPHLGKVPVRLVELPALQRVWRANTLPVGDDAVAVDALAASVDPSDDMVVVFTSGSSGAPKGVVHSHASALGAVRASLTPRCIDADTRLYLPMPFFWVGGLAGGVFSALVAGATLVTEAIPRPQDTLALLERERVTLFRGWPQQAEALARCARPGDLGWLGPGSPEALLPPERRSAPGARASLFGMTETFGPYSGYRADTDMPTSAWGSCGKPFDGIEVRIVDVDSRRPVAVGEVGEILVRGPHTLRGMCGRAREEVFTADGFYATGDLGRLDAGGFLFHHGRSDDMFKVSGATVHPSEIEAALRTLAVVDEAHVTRVPGPKGDRVGALVLTKEHVSPLELTAAARTVLSTFKVPTVWLVGESSSSVPRGTTGKVDVRALRALLTEVNST